MYMIQSLTLFIEIKRFYLAYMILLPAVKKTLILLFPEETHTHIIIIIIQVYYLSIVPYIYIHIYFIYYDYVTMYILLYIVFDILQIHLLPT